MACDTRKIISPITGKEVESKTWKDIYNLVDEDEKRADELYSQLLSPSFIQFFGDWINNPASASKVVNKIGEPLVVYHGTNADFNTFRNPVDQFSYNDGGELGYGIYATIDKSYIYNVMGSTIVLPIFMNVRTPYIVKETQESVLNRANHKGSIFDTPDRVYNIYGDKNNINRINDGVFTENLQQLTAFNSNQIKSVFNEGNFSTQSDNIYEQSGNTTSSKASPKTLARVKDFLERINVDVNTGTSLPDGVNGRADALRGLIELTEGKESVALTEEAMHMAVELIEQKYPILFKQMFNKIGSYALYPQVLAEYRQNKAYQLTDGKPNIPKIKKEAIGKILAEYVIQSTEGQTEKPELIAQVKTWWNSVVDFLRGLFGKAGYNPFQDAANTVLNKDLGSIKDLNTEIKEGVSDVFSQNPNISSIGTQEQYSQYLDTIFPDSKVKSIVYRSDAFINENSGYLVDKTKVKTNNYSNHGIYLASDKEYAKIYGGKRGILKSMIIDFKNPKQLFVPHKLSKRSKENEGMSYDNLTKDNIDTLKSKNFDSVIVTKELNQIRNYEGILEIEEEIENFELIALEPEQIHILGSKEDEKGFKEFIKSKEFYQLSPSAESIIDKLEINNPIQSKDSEGNTVYTDTKGEQITNYVEKTLSKENKYTREPSNKQIAVNNYIPSIKEDISNIINNYIDEDKSIRTDVGGNLLTRDNNYVPADKNFYSVFEQYITGLLQQYSAGTKVFVNKVVADNNYAGKIDLLIISPNGKTDIIKWGITGSDDRNTDSSDFEKRMSTIELREYRNILKSGYGVKEFGRVRTIPISLVTVYNRVSKEYDIAGVEIGNLNAKTENKDYLLPIPAKEELTGEVELDKFISKAQKLFEVLSDEKINKEERLRKKLEMNKLLYAIRHLQVKHDVIPTLSYIELLSGQTKDFVSNYNTTLKNADVSALSKEEINNYSKDILKLLNKYIPFEGIDVSLREFTDSDEQLNTRMAVISKEMREQQSDLEKVLFEFGDKFIGKKNDVEGLLNPELEQRGIGRWTESQASGRTAALKTFHRIFSEQEGLAQLHKQELFNERKKLEEALIKEVGNKKDMYKYLLRKGEDGEYLHERINTIDRNFFEQIKTNASAKNLSWIKDNIDVDAYKAWASEQLIKESAQAETILHDLDPEKNKSIIDKIKDDLDIRYGLRTDKSPAWFNYKNISKFPLAKWESKEYTELKKHPASFSFYNYIQQRVNEAKESGFYTGWEKRTFLPYMRFVRGIDRIGTIQSVAPRKQEEGGIKLDPLTNERIFSFPKSTTYTIEETENIERDLFRAMDAFDSQLADYKYRSAIENQIDLIYYMERNKSAGAIQANKFGKPLIDKETGEVKTIGDNNTNADLFRDLRDINFFSQRDIGSTPDKVIATFTEKTDERNKKINKALGVNLLPTDMAGKSISLTGALEAGSNLFRMKALNLNITIPISNWIGGQMQAGINRGLFYTQKDDYLGNAKMTGMMANSASTKKLGMILDAIIPVAENLEIKRRRESTVNSLSHAYLTDFTMKPYEWSDKAVQFGIAIPMIDNAVVVEGKLLNARKHIRNKHKDRYNNPATLHTIEKQMETEIQELIKTNGFEKLTEEKDGKLIFPVSNEEIVKYRELVIGVIKQATGQITRDQRNKINATMLGRSFMTFKNWIPPLLSNRVKSLGYNPATDSLEWGRFQIFGNTLLGVAKGQVSLLKNLLSANLSDERGIAFMQTLLEEKKKAYEAATGQEWKFSDAEFMDMMRNGLKAQWQELAYTALLISMLAGLRAMVPDTDDPDKKNRGKWVFVAKQMEKVSGELTFFYNPLDMQKMANGSIIPAMGILTDLTKLLGQTGQEMFGDSEAAHPLKQGLKMIPILNQLNTYTAYLSEDYAKAMGIQVSATTNFIR